MSEPRRSDDLLNRMLAAHAPSDAVLHRLRARLGEAAERSTPPDPGALVSDIFRRAFRVLPEFRVLLSG